MQHSYVALIWEYNQFTHVLSIRRCWCALAALVHRTGRKDVRCIRSSALSLWWAASQVSENFWRIDSHRRVLASQYLHRPRPIVGPSTWALQGLLQLTRSSTCRVRRYLSFFSPDFFPASKVMLTDLKIFIVCGIKTKANFRELGREDSVYCCDYSIQSLSRF